MFCISRGWVEKCFRQHYFSLLACTPVTQKLLTKLEILMKFYKNSTAIYIEMPNTCIHLLEIWMNSRCKE